MTSKQKVSIQTRYGFFDVIFQRDGRNYLVQVPKYPEIVTFGKSFAHAKRMAKDAIEVAVEGEVLLRAKERGIIRFLRVRPA